MIVGSHELKGIVEKLKQPFCVLQKHVASDDDARSDVSHQDLKNASDDTATRYIIKGMITRKLLFQHYPKTILRSSAS